MNNRDTLIKFHGDGMIKYPKQVFDTNFFNSHTEILIFVETYFIPNLLTD